MEETKQKNCHHIIDIDWLKPKMARKYQQQQQNSALFGPVDQSQSRELFSAAEGCFK